MHSAPSVSYPVGRSRNAGHLVLALWLLGVLVAVVASAQSPGMGWRSGVLFLGTVVAALGAWTGWRRPSGSVELTFDGQCWSMSGDIDVPEARAGVMLDLQALLLIRFTEPLGSARWIWAERRAMPLRWRDLRRALYSRAAPTEAATRPLVSNSANAQQPSP